jgi:predicted GIY-YIG superfamily endonuclease
METDTVYLLHFHRRYWHAGHYLGATRDLTRRLLAHEHGRGARLLTVIHEAGITWELARTWRGGWKQERKLKRQKNGVRLCPICKRRKLEIGARRQANRRPPRD